MRILFLTSTFEPLTGGAETYAQILTTNLASAGHDVTVVTDGSWLDDLPEETTENGRRVLRLRRFASEVDRRDKVVWRQLQYAVLNELGQMLDDESYDVVHANSHETLQLGLPVAEDRGAALVASLHEQNPDLEAFGAGRCRLAYAVLPVDMHIAASRFYRDRAVQFGTPTHRLRLIYHGVEPQPATSSRDKAEARSRLGLPASGPVVVCAGRLYHRKGHIYLAEAFDKVRAAHPDVHLLLAGRVSDFTYAREVFDRLASAGEAGAVTHREDLTLADMSMVFAAADVVVQPSLEEGLGFAAIEAMQYGVPLVASDVVGLAEVVQDKVDGLLVPPRNPDALADGLIQLIGDAPMADRLATGGRLAVAGRFSAVAMRDATLEAYGAALDNRRVR